MAATLPDRAGAVCAEAFTRYVQTLGALGVIDNYLKDAGLDRTRVVKAEVAVTDPTNKPAFNEAGATWMPAGYGPVRSFVPSTSYLRMSKRFRGYPVMGVTTDENYCNGARLFVWALSRIAQPPATQVSSDGP